MNKNDKKVRANIRKELGYRQPRIKSGSEIVDNKAKSERRSRVKEETRREVRENVMD